MTTTSGTLTIQPQRPVMTLDQSNYLTESVTLTDVPNIDVVTHLADNVAFDAQARVLVDALLGIADGARLTDLTRIVYPIVMAEHVTLGDSPVVLRRVAVELADAVTLIAGAAAAHDANVLAATTLVLADAARNVVAADATDAVVLADTPAGAVGAALRVIDSVRLLDAVPAPSITLAAIVAETLDVTDTARATHDMMVALADGIGLLAELVLDDGAYLAWVVNTDNKAFSQYRNYPFTSFATIGGQTYATGPDGLYLLEGDDDAGEPIEATLRGALDNLGSSLLKRMPSAYMGYTTDGRLLFKVTVVNGDGDREEHWYTPEDRRASATREGRVKLGRGLKSTYWAWELSNIDGADFALDEIAWYPVILQRRL